MSQVPNATVSEQLGAKEETTTAPAADATTRESVADMKKMLMDGKTTEDGKSAWTMTLETFGMADGKHHKSDVIVDTIEKSFAVLGAYVTDDQMQMVPLAAFVGATKEQFLRSFLKWAETNDGKEDKNNNCSSSGTTTAINVSKARRRLDAYFNWMNDNQHDLTEPPLTAANVAEAGKVWDVQITYDINGSFVWWIDLGRLDKEELRKISNRDHLRYIVWLSHLIMLDARAQENGAKIVEDLGMMGFVKTATLVSPSLGAKMDRLTIGILPVKMNKIYIFGAARWMNLLMSLLKPFTSKKMRQRLVILPQKTDPRAFCEDIFTRKNIPRGFSSLEGEADGRAVLESFQ